MRVGQNLFSACGRGASIFHTVSDLSTVGLGVHCMKRVSLCAVSLGLILVPILAGQKKKMGAPSAATLAHGKYLVDNVAGCADCHSPVNEKGEVVKEQYLQGAALPFKPSVPMPVWADTAPNIAGLPGWDKDAAIKFLMTGIAYNGLPARPPMPQFRLHQQDAVAIVEYLKSLQPAAK
jgi:mono/diheme cytochrome c family protein